MANLITPNNNNNADEESALTLFSILKEVDGNHNLSTFLNDDDMNDLYNLLIVTKSKHHRDVITTSYLMGNFYFLKSSC